uniref:CSON002427 protein n=1 Tax=Culicoides sonorensis TaxID=179676 RepID=A0A336MQ15_CULSO
MTGKTVLFISVIVLLFNIVIAQYNLPSYIQVCRKDDPKLGQCMKKSVEGLRPYLRSGIKELDIPPIEPILIGDLIVSESVPGQGVSITARDVKAYGPSNFILKKLDVVEYAKKYNFKVELPQLYAEGTYDIDGRILLIPVKGNGRFHGNFSRALADVRVRNEIVTKPDGQTYSVVKKIDIKIQVKDGKIRLDNLFGGDRVLGDVINETINRNFDILSKEIIPLIERALSKYFKKVGNKILGTYPESVLFP